MDKQLLRWIRDALFDSYQGRMYTSPSAADAKTVTGSGSAWANPSWTELIATTTTKMRILIVTLASLSATPLEGGEIDLAIGAAGLEVVKTTFRIPAGTGGGCYNIPCVDFPAGVRVAARLRTKETTPITCKLILNYIIPT
jgi:hypothetical protein